MMPPGQMAEALGANGYGVCPKCKGNTFHLMVRVQETIDTLVVTKCANEKCDNEAPVPFEDKRSRKWQE
jgi:hypothetical protein